MKKRNLCYLCFFSFFFLFPKKGETNSLENGEKLFIENCNVCHIGGKNLIIPEKNLQKSTLQLTGMNTLKAIEYQITNGKNGMPAFGGRLEEKDIENIAIYVLDQAEKSFQKE